MKHHEELMFRCIELARESVLSGNYPLGALVAANSDVIAEVSSTLKTSYDPTAHPETVAIRTAAEHMQSRYLPDYTLYTTLEPCVMCTGAAVWAKMGGIVFGSSQEDAVAWTAAHPDPNYSWRQISIKAQAVVDASNRNTFVLGNVLGGACNELFALAGTGDNSF